MRWSLFIFPFLFFISCSRTASTENDFVAVANDSIRLWANMAKNNVDLSIAERKALVNKAHQSNKTILDKNERVRNLSRISLAFLRLDDSLNFRKTNAELTALARQTDNKLANGEAHWDLGDFFKRVQPDSAYYHFKEAHELFDKANLGDKKHYPGRMLVAMADILQNSKDYVGAEKDIIAAIDAYKKIDAKDRLFNAYNSLGVIQAGMKKYDKALEFYEKANALLPFVKSSRKTRNRLAVLNNIALNYLDQKKFDEAHTAFVNLENEAVTANDSSLIYRKIKTSEAISGFKSNRLEAKEALAMIEASNQYLEAMGNQYDQARNKQYAAEILRDEGRIWAAQQQALQAKTIAENTGNNDRLLKVLKFLTQVDMPNSARHAKAYFDLNEQLQLQERNMQDKFARIRLETDEVIEKNVSLSKRTELLAGVAIGLLILGIGIFTIISQRVSNQELKFKQKQQESNQEIYGLMLAQHGKMEEGKKSEQKRVSEELHDGILGQMLGIRLILSGLNERNDASAIEQRAELIVKLQELEEEIRTISHELNAAAYSKVHNFILSLADLIETVQKSSGIEIHFRYDEQFAWDTLNGDIKINTYRITQELLQNCVKHAKCSNIQVSFHKSKNLLHLKVSDDGIGFQEHKAKRGIGLKNIISRVNKMGGQLEIAQNLERGSAVTVKIPNIDLKKQHPNTNNERKEVVEI